MVWLLGALLALYGLGDLFGPHGQRSLPWWGDLIAIVAGALIVLINRVLSGDDD